ncbi:MAG: hypothetical protein J6A01_00955 [Proteobacteria bacterium]|nr:hypothetical protein [Pseudomonadota bacterium]
MHPVTCPTECPDDCAKAGVVDLTGNYFDYPFPAIEVNWNTGVRPAL